MSRWLESDHCLVIAHRGASAAAPENTLAAFRLAADLGADGIELDVRATADNHLVVIHDAAVDRTTDGTGTIAALTLAQVRRFDAGGRVRPAFAGERIPLLADVFDVAGERLLVDVEVKAAGVESALIDLIRGKQMTESVVITSFDVQVVARVRELAPEISAGLLQSAAHPQVAVQLGAAVYLPEVGVLTADIMTLCRRHGLRVIPWTVRTEGQARHALRLGVDGIIADDPVFIRKMLARSKTST